MSGDPTLYPPWCLPHQQQATLYQFMQIGCICPAGANKECERPDCPRKSAVQEAPEAQKDEGRSLSIMERLARWIERRLVA